MSQNRITFTLNELVTELNSAADRILRAEYGITYSQFLFLVTLEACGPTGSSNFAEKLGVSRAAVSQRLPWFVERGYVQITSQSESQKQFKISLTKKGSKLAAKCAENLELQFRSLAEKLKFVDLEKMNQELEQIKQFLIASKKEK